MSVISTVEAPPRRALLKATAISVLVATVLLVTVVLPAEYGIDPTGVGGTLGLTTLAHTVEVPAAAGTVATGNDELTQKAIAAFGASDKQSFAPEALSAASALAAPKLESMTITLAPGKGAEVKTVLKPGDGLVFRWTSSGDVAVDMHGEQTGVKGAWTSYSVEPAQRAGSGTFIAPFEGSHGWYWGNRGTAPVTVQIDVSGFQSALYQP